MAGNLLIKNALIITGNSGRDNNQKLDILVQDGIIASIEPSIGFKSL